MASGGRGLAAAPPQPPQPQSQSLPPLYAQRPAYSFTIPSLHNDSNAAGEGVQLECRVYHPPGYVAGLMAMRSDAKAEGEREEEDDDGDDDRMVMSGRRGSVRKSMEKKKKAAIIAHPYAPLGGSYDDPVVGNAGAEMLALGWVVGTFCFR
ncbi:hypothetical protein BFW01_g5645 [Lasiodiplodia theobromae]|uniref:Uncharacterized protein n=1 Tax=Lasiodiplodia theobromae TaxID=45133 RepID=A0A5N5DA69_9PEZI|nr:hypothetical protein DBV05_g7160 [Lasiodiplodia theobromae]KAF9634750.1 hypothetical protein BFW01_g5645 [Lasiodiplodia theobromae]